MLQGQEDWLVRERQQGLLEEMQYQQLLRLAQGGQPATSRYYDQALFWVGQRLTGWGARLQERHAPTGC